MVEKVYIGVDVGGTNTKIALIDEKGTILGKNTIPTNAMRPAEEVVNDIAREARRLRSEIEKKGYQTKSLGIGIPGLIDWNRGVCLLLPNFPNKWKHIPIQEWLQKALSLPVAIINDARAITLAEKRFGAGKNVQSMIMIAIGTGVGGGVIINGNLYIGKDGSAGEFGHITVMPGGVRCGCGNQGCLESYASGPAMVGQALRALVQQNDTMIREMVNGDLNKVTPRVIVDAAKAGDDIAHDIIQQAGMYIGQALSTACVAVNPEMIVIGGGVAHAGLLLFESILQGIKKHLFIVQADTTPC
ncbi:MAG: ROK family protein, partial [Candidatus Atribacteria bacterium]|nr:ROK family protein [Candidatus Atribacteria bacterium]